MRRQRILATLVLTIAVVGLSVTGCDKSRKELQADYRAEGMKYMQEGKFEEAAKIFQKGLAQSNGEIGDVEYDLCFLKAKALYLSGDAKGAMEVYDSIIAYEDCAQAHYFKGNLYYAQENETQALEEYAKAIELDETNYDIYIGIYDSLIAHNQKTLGEEYLNKALSMDGKMACDDMTKGRIYYCLNDEKLALEYLNKADAAGEEEASFYIAMVYMNAGDAKADEYFQKFLKTEYATSDRLYEMGDLAMGLEKYNQAVVYFEAALKQTGTVDEQVITRNLVRAYEYSGQFEKAKNLLKDYVEKYPADDKAKRELVFLNSR